MWIERPLAELATITSGGTPSRDVAGYWGGEIPWVTPSDITACTKNVLRETKERITSAGLAASAARMVPAESILLTSRATVGEARMAGMPLCTNQGFKALTAAPGIDPWFLFYQVQRCRGQFERFAAGSTFLEIGKRDTERVRLAHPVDVVSQKRIAAILTSLDTVIEATEALIEKHQQIKAGLMLDLFTRGLLPNGELRPAIDEAPSLYADSTLGPIPKEWQVTTCEAVCERVIDCKNRTPPETPDGYPVIRTPNVRGGEFIDDELVYTDAKSYEIWTARGKPVAGDIVITREAPVGEVCMIPPRHAMACLGQRMMLYRPDVGRIDATFFLFALQSNAIQSRLDLISGGSTVGHVRVGDIRSLWMYLPSSIEEQQRIGSALSAMTARLRANNEALAKLRMQKQGLMQDLLTGKVPVRAN